MRSAVRWVLPITFAFALGVVGHVYGQPFTLAANPEGALSVVADGEVHLASSDDEAPTPATDDDGLGPILPGAGQEGSMQPTRPSEPLPSPTEPSDAEILEDPTGEIMISPEAVEDGWAIAEDGGPLLWKHKPLFNDTGTWFWRGHWYARQEFVALILVTQKNRRYAIDSSSNANNQRLTPDSDPHGWEPGMRVTFGNIIGRDKNNRDHALEFSFTGLFEFTSFARLEARTPGSVNTLLSGQFGGDGNPSAAFSGANNQSVQFDSDYNSFETNLVIRSRLKDDRVELQPNGKWVRHSNPGIIRAFRLGVRTLTINERFLYSSRGPNNGDLDIFTYNDMFGPQIGFELIEQRPHWAAGIRTMAGGLYNFASRHIRLETDIDDVITEEVNNEADDQMNFFAELKISGTYNLRPNVAVFGSYEIIYLSGVASAEKSGILAADVRGV